MKQLPSVLKHDARHVHVSQGDDAAIVRASTQDSVMCTDMIVEGVDFETSWSLPKHRGAKAAAINLSDLAAMGAQPRALLSSIAKPPSASVQELMQITRSLHRVGLKYGAPLIGGDVSSTSGPWVISVTAFGTVPVAKALRRYRAKPGDLIFVSGFLGNAAAGLQCLQQSEQMKPRVASKIWHTLTQAQRQPVPRVELGLQLRRWGYVRACADISDGLAKDVLLLPQAGAGVALNLNSIPIEKPFRIWADTMNVDAVALALTGGEDFELVFAVPPQRASSLIKSAKHWQVPLCCVGEVVAKPGLFDAATGCPLNAKGFFHT